ncbi:hypothetical protein Lal_00013091 [Lupinus albus]|nr:hypothetical protein Lal_00013091 [Lupinus albus]
MEAIPAALAGEVTRLLAIPTIGIGAGLECSGQVLVMHDMLGVFPGHRPKFVRNFMDGQATIDGAVAAYVAAVKDGTFPARNTPSPERPTHGNLVGHCRRLRPACQRRCGVVADRLGVVEGGDRGAAAGGAPRSAHRLPHRHAPVCGAPCAGGAGAGIAVVSDRADRAAAVSAAFAPGPVGRLRAAVHPRRHDPGQAVLGLPVIVAGGRLRARHRRSGLGADGRRQHRGRHAHHDHGDCAGNKQGRVRTGHRAGIVLIVLALLVNLVLAWLQGAGNYAGSRHERGTRSSLPAQTVSQDNVAAHAAGLAPANGATVDLGRGQQALSPYPGRAARAADLRAPASLPVPHFGTRESCLWAHHGRASRGTCRVECPRRRCAALGGPATCGGCAARAPVRRRNATSCIGARSGAAHRRAAARRTDVEPGRRCARASHCAGRRAGSRGPHAADGLPRPRTHQPARRGALEARARRRQGPARNARAPRRVGHCIRRRPRRGQHRHG